MVGFLRLGQQRHSPRTRVNNFFKVTRLEYDVITGLWGTPRGVEGVFLPPPLDILMVSRRDGILSLSGSL